MLCDPTKRIHVGPCCVTFDGTIRGTKKWGDFKGCASTDPDVVVFECMGCRKLLARPEVDEDGHDWSTLDATVAQHKNAKADAEEGA